MLRLLDKYASVNCKKFKIYNKDSFMDSYFSPTKEKIFMKDTTSFKFFNAFYHSRIT